MAIIFDGASAKYGSYPNENLISRDVEHTFAVWFKPDSGATTRQWLAGMDQGTTGNFRAMGYTYRGDQTTKSLVMLKNAGSDAYDTVTAALPIPDQWNVAVQARPSSGGLNVTTMTNFALNETDQSYNTTGVAYGNVNRFVVGAQRTSNAEPQYSRFFAGKIWGWAIWHRLLTEVEIDSLQSGAHPNSIPSGLVELHHFQTANAGLTTSVSQVGSRTMTFAGTPVADTDSPFPSQTISNINSGAGIKIGSTGNTALTTGFTTAPTTVSIGALACTITNYNSGTGVVTFNVPAPTHTFAYPDINSNQTVTVSNGSETATLTNVPFSPPTGSTPITVASPVNNDDRYLGYWLINTLSVTPVNGDKFYGVDADVTWLANTGGNASSLPVVTPVTYWDASTGFAYNLSVTVNPDGVVTPSILILNNELRAGQANSWTVSGFTPTSVSFAGLNITTFSNSSITIPGYVNGAIYPVFGIHTLSATDGVSTVELPVTLLPTSNYTYSTLTNTSNYSPGYIQGWTDCAVTDQIVFNTASSLGVADNAINSNGLIHTDRTTGSDLIVWHRRASDGLMKQLTLKVD